MKYFMFDIFIVDFTETSKSILILCVCVCVCVCVCDKLFIYACAYVYIPVLGRNKGKDVFDVYSNLLTT